ncbi:MAG TPA: hypothetical protein VLJ79_28705 [Candidatus Binatia bacterium]|nr:hypothetical protein [Candidatus Binatia bacterium]
MAAVSSGAALYGNWILESINVSGYVCFDYFKTSPDGRDHGRKIKGTKPDTTTVHLVESEKTPMKAGDNAKASLQAAMATVALAVVTAACGAPSASRDVSGTREIVTARGQLDDYMAQCTSRLLKKD